MKCVRPKLIPKPGLPDRPMAHIPGTDKTYLSDFLVVPCGKCFACTKARQDNFACRIRAEADKRGKLSLVTLTYNEDSLPLVSTLWQVDKSTGESVCISEPDFVCYSRKEDFFSWRKDMRELKPSRFARFIDIPYGFEDDDYAYFMRITPSVCRRDVQLWLKQCRIKFQRAGKNLDFSYAICSEYGPRTCRPHYHCVFLGLDTQDVEAFARLWTFGYTDVRHVDRVNPDGSDGFSRVSDYIGKYISKGIFECDSVKCGAACNTRMMSSNGLCSAIVDKFRDYALAVDVIGARYNPDTFFIPDKKRYLTRQELVSLCSEVPKRLSISFDGKRYFAFPRILRNKIFYVQKKSEEGNYTYRRPSRLWKMVTDAISKQYADLHQREFDQFCSHYPPGKLREAVAAFYDMQEASAKLADDIGKSRYQAKLSKSLF